MINYELPTEAVINGNTYKIRNKGDYRVVLDAISALNDKELSQQERIGCALFIFYEDTPSKDDMEDALYRLFEFISCDETDYNQEELEKGPEKPPLMDWDHDFHLLVAPISKVIGKDIRSLDYLHWFSFIAAYMEIGECTFSQVISIRSKMQKGQKLDKSDQEYIREHREDIYLPNRLTQEEQDYLTDW